MRPPRARWERAEPASAAVARAAGAPYDEGRVDLFQNLAAYLDANPPVIPERQPGIDSALQAFLESYFSNCIEGTEFELEEAHAIVMANKPLRNREDDSHGAIGTLAQIWSGFLGFDERGTAAAV